MIFLRPTLANVLKIGGLGIVGGGMLLQPYRPLVVVGKSMEPTYHNQSLQWTLPVAKDELRRGQVVEINMPTGPIIKRIAYLSGDKITQMRVGTQWVDMLYVHLLPNSKLGRIPLRKVTVPPNMAYVLGDNQTVSYDSRNFGFISQDRIRRIVVDQEPPAAGSGI